MDSGGRAPHFDSRWPLRVCVPRRASVSARRVRVRACELVHSVMGSTWPRTRAAFVSWSGSGSRSVRFHVMYNRRARMGASGAQAHRAPAPGAHFAAPRRALASGAVRGVVAVRARRAALSRRALRPPGAAPPFCRGGARCVLTVGGSARSIHIFRLHS